MSTPGLLRAEARKALPVGTYLKLLHMGALTGKLPVLDPETHKPTGDADDLTGRERRELLAYLINKVLPDVKYDAAEEKENLQLDQVVEKPAALAKMSQDDLHRLIDVAYAEEAD